MHNNPNSLQIFTEFPSQHIPKNKNVQKIHYFLLSLLVILSCNQDDNHKVTPSIDRATFISTYVALSTADMENLDTRDHILDSLSVTQQDLESFVTYHGKDVDFMADLWGEIQSQINQDLNDPITTL